MDFPYQLVTFFGKEPQLGEAIYGGKNGWYPQIALKRRFGLNGISENTLITRLENYCHDTPPFTVEAGQVLRPEHMPVEVLEVNKSSAIMGFHQGFIRLMHEDIKSKYPDREDGNFYPHITLEYWKRRLFDPTPYIGRKRLIEDIWLVKDFEDEEESGAFKKFRLGN